MTKNRPDAELCGCDESQDYLDVLKKIYFSIKHINDDDRTTLEKQAFSQIEFVTRKYNRKK